MPFMTLQEWLHWAEVAHSKPIDMGLDRVRAVAQRMGLDIQVPVITVAGTNGKGSTCAMLEGMLEAAGFRTGLYTSPHLVDFEERCRIRQQPVEAQVLVKQCERVRAALVEVSLTYFEFTTLAILGVLAASDLDVLILEVGLGGRLDAVNLVDADVSIITSIDIDHTEFLGPDRESIGREKAGIMRAQRPVIVSDPMPPQSVLAHAQQLGADLWLQGRDFGFQGDGQQWSWRGRHWKLNGLAHPSLRGTNQLINASGVLAALEAMRERLPVSAQAVRVGLAETTVPGRFQIVPGQPVVVLDVAHNPHAVATLANNLDAMGFYPVTHAVMGAMADKDTAQMIQRLGPLVQRWHFTDLPSPRAATAQALLAQWQALSPQGSAQAEVHASPVQAMAAARLAADPADRILVFGSFITVGEVMRVQAHRG